MRFIFGFMISGLLSTTSVFADTKVEQPKAKTTCACSCGCGTAGVCTCGAPAKKEETKSGPKTISASERKLNVWYINNPDGTFTEYTGLTTTLSNSCSNGSCSSTTTIRGRFFNR